MKIYLIGFMGCGKTSIGKRLAKKLGYNFLDLDTLIEVKSKKKIPDIFRELGEDGFRKIERAALEDTFQLEDIVIATGGGTPCFFDNIDQINKHGLSFYLNRSRHFLVNKLFYSSTERPLVKGKSKNELDDYIGKLLAKRDFFYKKASFIVTPPDGFTKKDIAKMIRKFVHLMSYIKITHMETTGNLKDQHHHFA